MMKAAAMTLTMLALLPTAAAASDYDVGPMHIAQPWARATPKGAQVGGGYLTVSNRGTTPDRLTCVSVEASARCEVHTMVEKDGVSTMRPMADGLEIKAGETVALQPGSFHLMFVDLKSPLERGKPVKGVLKFEKAGTVNVEFQVEPVGAPGPAGHRGH